MNTFYQLKVTETKQETADSVSISFKIPSELKDIFIYKAGQYITLKFNLNGKEERRAYSISSSPILTDGTIQVGVKRVTNGLVSNHINDFVKVGSVVQVSPPEGRFYVETKQENTKTYYLFTAGSGITPIISILKTILLTEPNSLVYMMYGNRSQDNIIFKTELIALQKEYANRFVLVHALSKPKSSFWSNKYKMEFRKGRVNKEAIKWFMSTYPAKHTNSAYYICGPGTMITDTKNTLSNIKIPQEEIFIESFGDGVREDTTTKTVAGAKLVALLDNEKIELEIPKGKTVLRTLLEADYDPPYSCEGGVCSSCICKVTKGKAHMNKNMALTDVEVLEGYILSCQAIPLTNILEVDFDD